MSHFDLSQHFPQGFPHFLQGSAESRLGLHNVHYVTLLWKNCNLKRRSRQTEQSLGGAAEGIKDYGGG